MKALLIDLDGVIRIWPTSQDQNAEDAVGLPTGAIKRVAFATELLVPTITGQQQDEVWRQQIIVRLQELYPTVDVARAVAIWSEPCGEVDGTMLELLRFVRETCPVCLITNATSRLPTDLERLGIQHEFDCIINSAAVGVAKPQPAIFQAALTALGVDAADALFVDDTAKNVLAAEALGIMGHHYQGYTGLCEGIKRAQHRE